MHPDQLLLDLPDSVMAVLLDERCRTPEFCDRFIERVEDVRFADPQTALGLAEAALCLATLIPIETYGLRLPTLWRARALIAWAGVQRTLARFEEAEAAYLLAAELLRLMNGGRRERAHLCRRLGYLRRDQQRFAEARTLVGTAIQIYQASRDRRSLGHSLVDLGSVLIGEGRDYQAAAEASRAALKLLGPTVDRRYYHAAVHNLAVALARSCSPSEVPELLGCLQLARELGSAQPGSVSELKFRWLEGIALDRAGQAEAAAERLTAAQQGLLRLDAGVEAAVVSLDLALVYLENGRFTEVQRLAGEMFPVFQALAIDREAMAALQLYVDAAKNGTLTAELVHRVQAVLDQGGYRAVL